MLKIYIWRTLKILLILSLCALLASFIYFGRVWLEAENKFAELEKVFTTTDQLPIILDQGTVINASHINYYSLFSGDNINIKDAKLSLSEDKKLFAIPINTCPETNCFQQKATFNSLPSAIWKSLIGIEDSRFLEHQGVDLYAIARALVIDILAMKFVQGGSTLTQQLIKNMYFSNQRNLERKIKEIIYATYAETKLSKDQIIQAYLNEVEWGVFQGVRIKGVKLAALTYFNKPLDKISEFEAIILVSMLKGPAYFSPINNLPRLQSRVQATYNRLKDIKYINSEAWTENVWKAWAEDLTKRNKLTYFKSLYEVSLKNNQLLNSFEEFILIEGVKQVSRTVVEKTGEKDFAIKILIHPIRCNSDKCIDDYKYYSKIERSTEIGIEKERHQVGSILKPIIYNFLLDSGVEFGDLVSTAPLKMRLKSGVWEPQDHGDPKEKEITVLKALQQSRNRPLIRLAEKVGFEKVEARLKEYIPHLFTPLAQYPAQLLGSVEMSLGEVSQAYGMMYKDICRKIGDGEQTFEESVMGKLADANESTIVNVANQYFKSAKLFGKTGTTNKGKENWYVAIDGTHIYIIWAGFESVEKYQNFRISGASTAYNILQNFLQNRGRRLDEMYCVE
jgi:penicillin-binding protein 1B